jgi:hypothetical protein
MHDTIGGKIVGTQPLFSPLRRLEKETK